MEIYYLHDAPKLGSAVVIASTVAALAASVDDALRAAASAAEPGERLVIALLWPSAPQDIPMLTTLDERLDYLAHVASTHGHALTALVTPIDDDRPGALSEVLAAIEARVSPRAMWLSPEVAHVQPERTSTGALAPETIPSRGYPITQAREHSPMGGAGMYAAIDRALTQGALAVVTEALGTYYPLTGLVVTGDQRGRALGFPTANLQLDTRKLLPPNGIYAVRVRLPGEARATHPGAASIGVRPTFGAGLERKVEVFLLDTSLDLYGQVLGVQMVSHLRSEERFDSVEALCAQMARDVAHTRTVLATAPER